MEAIEIAGAGPAGLAAAITLAQAGRRVVVHEARSEVGSRFGRDLQGLENWTTEEDVLEHFRALGLNCDFEKLPCREGWLFDAWGKCHALRSDAPVFYLVERGPGRGSLDSALLRQALALGVEVRFESRIQRLEGPGIFATGPRGADAIAVGYHFDTPMEDGFWVICDDALAPLGYAYLLVMGGRGTVKSCMFAGFRDQAVYVERTVEAFRRLAGLTMKNPRRHGGAARFLARPAASFGGHAVAGEQAGFQDPLWGFGIRLAAVSGVLAARSLLGGSEYDAEWRRELGAPLHASHANRPLWGLLGNRGYRWFLRLAAASAEPRRFLRRWYRPSPARRLLAAWANSRYPARRRSFALEGSA
jgi:flavin-dependent dehydrogenase